jgi:hypothetical protein
MDRSLAYAFIGIVGLWGCGGEVSPAERPVPYSVGAGAAGGHVRRASGDEDSGGGSSAGSGGAGDVGGSATAGTGGNSAGNVGSGATTGTGGGGAGDVGGSGAAGESCGQGDVRGGGAVGGTDPSGPDGCSLIGTWNLESAHGTVESAGVIAFEEDGTYHGLADGADTGEGREYTGVYSLSASTFHLIRSVGDGCTGSGVFAIQFAPDCTRAHLVEQVTECTGNRTALAGTVDLQRQ